MPTRILGFIDTLIISVVTLAVATSTELLATESATGEVAELRQLLIPLIGALITSGGMIMFQIEKEPRNIVLGRAIFGLFFGSGSMQLIAVFFPSLASYINKPIFLLLSGGAVCMVVYAIAYAFAKGLSSRSNKFANSLLDKAERQAGLYVPPDSTLREVKKDSFIKGAEAGIKEAEKKNDS